MTMTSTEIRVWSSQQEDIFNWFADPANHVLGGKQRNLIARARAGTGKTTTILEGCSRAPEMTILLCAFNNKISVDATKKLAEMNLPVGKVLVKTLHALGFACIRKFRDRIVLDKNGGIQERIVLGVCGPTAPSTILKLVAKLHTKGREMAPHSTVLGDLTDIAIQFECVPGEEWDNTQYNLDYVESMALKAMDVSAAVKDGGTIDFTDMIFLPVRNGWLVPQYDLVVVDEAQDMTTTQLEITQGVCKGRQCIVGDDKQAIYGFRGADSGSLDRLKIELEAMELGLKTTYRCAKSIVREAQRFVPDFEAGADNPEGEVRTLPGNKLTEDAGPGNFILSRLNAPLVSIAMNLLRAGKRTRVAGQDIGAGLQALVRKFKARSVPEFLQRVSAWEEREAYRLAASFKGKDLLTNATYLAKLDAIHDKAAMLVSLSDGARNVDEIADRIDGLFTDDGLGDAGLITCSSVHRAKGLEADKVYVLADTLRSNNQEELNICYVAITRAKSTLVYVKGA